MDQSELKHNLIGLDIGEEFQIIKDLKVKAFIIHHVIPNQVTYTVTSPEIAFTGDPISDFVADPENRCIKSTSSCNGGVDSIHDL
ncbi:hypothetical protein J5N97_017851 [Dioscorea zingiberensis]|uniref:Uncharacterized protein n=1 Tax=Dioscorea zingiberensis TaxID=325984 RepID=A0A9D5HGL1_9LILI|nr:hypothetical protein J5N97_017851 [Dioscorea zingiberensis]